MAEATKHLYKFVVDGGRFETEKRTLSGREIKAIAGSDPGNQLYLEEHGHDKPDRRIDDDASVDLGAPGVEKFYTVPPATFGAFSGEQVA